MGYIDVEYRVNNSAGITEYYVETELINFTGQAIAGVQFQLGFGTGTNFGLANSLAGEGLDFDTPTRDTGINPATGLMAGAFQRPAIFNTLDHGDTVIAWSNGMLGNRMPNFHWYALDVPDYDGAQMPEWARILDNNGAIIGYKFTIRTIVTAANPAMMAPMANNDAYNAFQGQTLSISSPGVLLNDSDQEGDPLTVTLKTAPTNGTVTLNSNGSFEYTPNAGFVGTDSFMYWAFDGVNYSNDAFVTLNVQPPPEQEQQSVGGRAWRDANRNGVQDIGESGIAGLMVRLFAESGRLAGGTWTDSQGNYRFVNVAPGIYYVVIEKPRDHRVTDDGRGTDRTRDSDFNADGISALFSLSGRERKSLDAGFISEHP
ncbi:MAG: Ig-like domain-containing protein [Verrucomicrobia subdivision 3 bacterium]|nr:Ig-like domain-containing protein [Limisphaerales bacterium]